MKSIILVGFMACGKSTLGIEVANNFNLDFFDTDKIITYVYNATISDIFYKYGQEHFIECEFNVINSLINKKCVISIGGAGFIREKTFNLIKKDLISIYIKVSVKALYNRLKQNNDYKNRPNIIPIIEDARKPHKYRMLVSMVDCIFSDVAQPD